MGPRGCRRAGQIRPWASPRTVLGSSWCAAWFDLQFGIVFASSSALLGNIFGLLWCHLRPFGANVRFLGAVLVSFSGFWGRCSFANCPFAFDRLSLFHLSMSLVSFPFVVDRLLPFDLSMVLLVPGPCGLHAARLIFSSGCRNWSILTADSDSA